ncbi:hypothetical protein [Magnetovibrio blakemorei]|uniref:TolC family protein n=1 Tax=Magnetovibrio blakemorei TaxID=28181 RepID=A0A1E5Q953_9PROT|nr:hypothetical protein [Magnetovibrio blakemorei]OEJ67988.1 hypothetical protein BEN30_06860 [Magnetovibrio blakemorei]
MHRILMSLSVFAIILSCGQVAHAQAPQTDVALVSQMKDAPAAQKLEALALYYDLHVSELMVQNMNELRTGALFAKQEVIASGGDAAQLAAVDLSTQKVLAEHAVRLEENVSLRTKLGALSGLELDDPLVMPPDAPLQAMSPPQGTPADLVQALGTAWTALEAAKTAWQDERLILLDAQQRYDDTRDVAIGDHMRAMTVAEAAYTKAIGAYRLIVAKIAVNAGQDLGEVLGAL